MQTAFAHVDLVQMVHESKVGGPAPTTPILAHANLTGDPFGISEAGRSPRRETPSYRRCRSRRGLYNDMASDQIVVGPFILYSRPVAPPALP